MNPGVRPAPGLASGTVPRAASGALAAAGALAFTCVGAVGVTAVAGRSLPAAVLAAVALPVGVLLARRPDVLCVLAVVGATATSGVQRGLPVPGLRPSEALVAFAAVAVLLLGPPAARARWSAIDRAMAVFVLAGVVTALLGGGAVGSVLSQALGPLQYLLLFRVVVTVAGDPRVARRIVAGLLLVSVPVSLLAVAQVTRVAGVEAFIGAVTDRGELLQSFEYVRQARATSVFVHWHPLAAYLVLMVVLAGAVALHDRRGAVLPRWALAVIGAVDALALVLTAALTAVAGLAVCVAVLVVVNGRAGRRLLAWVSGGALAVLLLARSYVSERLANQFGVTTETGLPQGVDFRLRVWEALTGSLDGHWVVGLGAVPTAEVAWEFTENQYLSMIVRGGVILLAAFLLLTAVTAWVAAEGVSPPGRDEGGDTAGGALAVALSQTVLAVVVALTVLMNFVAPYLTFGGFSHAFWALAGAMVATRRSVTRAAAGGAPAGPTQVGTGQDGTVPARTGAGARA